MSNRKAGAAGYLHRLRDDKRSDGICRRYILTPDPIGELVPTDFDALAARCVTASNPLAVARLADELGLSIRSLRRLGVGWFPLRGAWTFPMHTAEARIVGIRLRFPSGRKSSVTGGREGLFVPTGLLGDGPLLIAEGPTDCAALLDLGFDAIGRPSCCGGSPHLIEFVQRNSIDEAVVVADADEAGQRGANELASRLAIYVPRVHVLTPVRGKDARDWKRKGATHEDVVAAILHCPLRQISIKSVRRGH